MSVAINRIEDSIEKDKEKIENLKKIVEKYHLGQQPITAIEMTQLIDLADRFTIGEENRKQNREHKNMIDVIGLAERHIKDAEKSPPLKPFLENKKSDTISRGGKNKKTNKNSKNKRRNKKSKKQYRKK